MPERNLVKVVHWNHCFMMLVVALTMIALQLGCSNLGQSTFKHDLLSGNSRQPRLDSDPSDLASNYIASTNAELDSEERRDEARIVGIRDADSSDIGVKLVASQPAPSIGAPNTDSSNSTNDLFCEHPAGCDCHKPKSKPKLPHAEPIDPPPITAQAPPSGLVNQPLTPILFDSKYEKSNIQICCEQ